jgi:integrase
LPLTLVSPKEGRTKFYRVRGHEAGVAVDKSTGTEDKRTAQRLLVQWRDEARRQSVEGHKPAAPTFASAVVAYLQAERSERFLKPLVELLGDKPLTSINQAAIDQAATRLYPDATAATRNRQVYSPVSAILRHAGVVIVIRRPKGAQGTPRTAWLDQREAFALMSASDAQGATFGALVKLLFYTGARLGEALALEWSDVDLKQGSIVLHQTKTDDARTAIVPLIVTEALEALPRDNRVFYPFTRGSHLYSLLADAAEAAGVEIPKRLGFHIARHTWANWMRRYAGLDTAALVETGAWRSRKAASVYEHLDASEESAKARLLPVPPTQ